jgi:hypothetical protein
MRSLSNVSCASPQSNSHLYSVALPNYSVPNYSQPLPKNALRAAIWRNLRDENNNNYVLEPLGHSGLSGHLGLSGLSGLSGHSGHSQRLRLF